MKQMNGALGRSARPKLAVPSKILNPNRLYALFGPQSIARVTIEDQEHFALVDSGSQVDTATVQLARRLGLKIKKLSNLAKEKVQIQGLGGEITTPLGYIEYNLKVHGVAGYNEDRVALIVPDQTVFAKKVPLIIGTSTIDRILHCTKEDEIGKLPMTWQRVRHARMWCAKQLLSDLGQQKYSNKGYGNLLNIDEIVRTKHRTMVPAGMNLLVKGKTDLVLTGASMYVITEPLKKDDRPLLPSGLYVRPCITDYKTGSQSVSVELYNLTERNIYLEKNTPIARMSAGDAVPDRIMMPGTMESLEEKEVSESKDDKEHLTPEQRRNKILEDLDLSGIDDWRPENKERALDLITEYNDIFSLQKGELGCTNLVEHRIELTDKTPFKERPRALPPGLIEEVRTLLAQMQDVGAIKHSQSAWSNAVVLVRKKDGSLRFCIDFRRLNEKTKKDAFPLPRIQESLDLLKDCAWFSTMDCNSGFWQVAMDPESKQYTAFTVGNLGFFECERMPFGLCNAPATFQRLMQNTLGELNFTMCLVYLDDIIVFSPTEEEHVFRLRKVFERLRQHGLKLKPSKCKFFQKEIDYLGHRVSQEGIQPNKEKIKAMAEQAPPKTVSGIRSFLGMASYYRRFIKNFAKIAEPLNALLHGENSKKKNEAVTLTEAALEAFKELKKRLMSTPVLAYPDPNKEYLLETDASGFGLGAVLSQKQTDGRYHPVAYGSRTLNDAERKYHSTKLEFLAMKWAIADHFSYYLMGQKFKVHTDNNPLTYCLTTAKLDAIRQRWIEELAPYEFSIKYIKGSDNTVADALSRTSQRLSGEETAGILKETPVGSSEEENPQMGTIPAEAVKVLFDEITSGPARRSRGMTNPPDSPPDKTVQVKALRVGDPSSMHVLSWRDEQAKDAELRMIVSWIRDHRSDKKPWEVKIKELRKEYHALTQTPEGAALITAVDKLVLVRGLLYYKHENKLESSPVLRFVVPKEHRRKALDGCHRDAGHWGSAKTYSLVEDRFWWPRVRRDVERMCKACRRCSENRAPEDTAELFPIIVNSPLELVHVDFTEFETNMDIKGEPRVKNLLVIQDHFSRFMRAFIVPDQKADTTARILYEEFIAIFGVPQRILSDNGKAFTSELVQELCDKFHIDRSFTTPFHAQCNGMVERTHQTLRRMIGKLDHERKENWPDHLPEIVHAFNSTRSSVTGYSPHFLMYGRRPRLPIDFFFPNPKLDFDNSIKGSKVKRMIMTRIEALRAAYSAARSLTEEEAQRQKRYYDRKTCTTRLIPEDVVLVRNDSFRGHRKLIDRWNDVPHKVISQVEGDLPCYIVEAPSGERKVLHRNRLFLVLRPDRTDGPVILSKLISDASQVTVLLPESPEDDGMDMPPYGMWEMYDTLHDPVEEAIDFWMDTNEGEIIWFPDDGG